MRRSERSGVMRMRPVHCAAPAKHAGQCRSPSIHPSRASRIAQLERELAKVTARAELLVDAQKKFSQLLGLTLPTPDVSTASR